MWIEVQVRLDKEREREREFVISFWWYQTPPLDSFTYLKILILIWWLAKYRVFIHSCDFQLSLLSIDNATTNANNNFHQPWMQSLLDKNLLNFLFVFCLPNFSLFIIQYFRKLCDSLTLNRQSSILYLRWIFRTPTLPFPCLSTSPLTLISP